MVHACTNAKKKKNFPTTRVEFLCVISKQECENKEKKTEIQK